MGPSRVREQKLVQDDMRALLRERDDRIAALETRLEAYGARASTAHTRLLKTIDVLDALRSQHALEISAEEHAKTKLAREVNCWRNVANDLEVERDELKDVVEDLIEKAGCISLNMQRGNLNFDHYPEQVAVSAIHTEGARDDHNDELLAYATSIIARLRMELNVERQSHSRSIEEANLRIEELEAKVAVREAELEKRITSPGDNVHQPSELQSSTIPAFEKQILGKRLPEPKPLSDEECLRFLEGNSARNRSLEIEIRQIAERLEQVRMASTSSGSGREAQSPKAVPTPSPRMRSASVDPSSLSRPLGASKAASTQAPAFPSTMLSIAQLDNQIRTMTTQVDALVSERTALIEAAARQRRVAEGISMDTFQDVLRVEGECVRLQAEVDDLREQLEHARSSARAREKALLHEIARLRTSLSSSSDPRPADDLDDAFGARPLEDNIAAEESMELASPLVPIVIPFPVHPSPGSDSEVDLVSFPFSPRHASSPVPGVPPTPPRRNSDPQDIQRVQAALDVAARTQLAQKEEALTQLCVGMERFQHEVQEHPREVSGDGG